MFVYSSEFNNVFTSSAYYHTMSDISEQEIVVKKAAEFIDIINDSFNERIECMWYNWFVEINSWKFKHQFKSQKSNIIYSHSVYFTLVIWMREIKFVIKIYKSRSF